MWDLVGSYFGEDNWCQVINHLICPFWLTANIYWSYSVDPFYCGAVFYPHYILTLGLLGMQPVCFWDWCLRSGFFDFWEVLCIWKSTGFYWSSLWRDSPKQQPPTALTWKLMNEYRSHWFHSAGGTAGLSHFYQLDFSHISDSETLSLSKFF